MHAKKKIPIHSHYHTYKQIHEAQSHAPVTRNIYKSGLYSIRFQLIIKNTLVFIGFLLFTHTHTHIPVALCGICTRPIHIPSLHNIYISVLSTVYTGFTFHIFIFMYIFFYYPLTNFYDATDAFYHSNLFVWICISLLFIV